MQPRVVSLRVEMKCVRACKWYHGKVAGAKESKLANKARRDE